MSIAFDRFALGLLGSLKCRKSKFWKTIRENLSSYPASSMSFARSGASFNHIQPQPASVSRNKETLWLCFLP